MVLAFLAGADLGLNVFRVKWKESTAVGLVGFFSSTGGAVVRLSAPRGFRQVFLQIPARMKTGFAPPRLAWRMGSANPAVCLLRPVRDGQIDGTFRQAENNEPNRVGSMEQSG